jgi:hypothetical protein
MSNLLPTSNMGNTSLSPPTGLLRYTLHAIQKHPRRITSRDLLGISPDIIQLDSLNGNLIEAHGHIIQDGIWHLTHRHQQQWRTDLQALGQRDHSTTTPAIPPDNHHEMTLGPRTQAPNPNKKNKDHQASAPPITRLSHHP